MDIKYVDQWEFNDCAENWVDFITGYNLRDIFFNRFKDQLSERTGKRVTKQNMFNALHDAFYEGYYNTYDLLEGLAQQYIKENDLFDQVFFIEDNEGLYRTTFYEVIPNNQTDLKRFIEKHLDACKDGFSEIVEDVIERRSRNTPA
jgi:hypothetical protein